MKLLKTVQDSLMELFKHLADAVDGGEELPTHLRGAYYAEFVKPHMRKFYGQLVDENHAHQME